MNASSSWLLAAENTKIIGTNILQINLFNLYFMLSCYGKNEGKIVICDNNQLQQKIHPKTKGL